MTQDPIVEEIHAIRADLSSEAGDDLHRIVEQAKRSQHQDAARSVVKLAPRPSILKKAS